MDAGTIAVLLKLQDEMSGPMRQAAKSVDALKAPLNTVEAEAKQAEGAMRNLGNETSTSGRKMQGSLKGLLDSISPVEIGLAGLVVVGKQAFDAASDMAESVSKAEVVFGSSAASIKRFSESAAENLGLSERAALEATGTFGNLFVSMEMSEPAAASMSRGIVQLAADLASFNNISTDEALTKLQAGLVGEVEPLRSLGVNLSAVTVQAKAMEMGLADNVKQLTAADKAQASYALILEQTQTAQGDFARTADGAANSLKTTKASIDDAKVALGQGLVPVVAEAARQTTLLVESGTQLVDVMNRLGGAIPGVNGDLIDFGGLLAASNPILSGFTGGISLMNGLFGETEKQAVPVIQYFREIAAVLADAPTNSPFTQELEKAIGLLQKMNGGDSSGGGSLAGKVGRDIASMFEAARRDSLGGLTEFANSAEMVAESVARATQNMANMGEASRLAMQGQENLNTAWGDATSAVGFWETNLQNAETALDILNRQQEQNGSLTEEQQRQYDILTEAQGRYKGGIEDTEGAVVNAAVAQAEFIKGQDNLNQLLADGKIAPADYAREMANLTAETDPATSSAYNLAGAQGDLQLAIEGVVNKLGNLLIDLGLLPESKRTEFQTPGMSDAQQNVDILKSKMGEVPDSMVITAHVDILQAQNALNELRGMTFTQSPPKKGPMAFVPNWNYLFEGLVESAETYGSQAMERLRSFLTGVDLDSIVDRQSDLQGDIANLTTVRDAMAEIGDTEAVAALNAELERLSAEAANLAGIVGTDAVQAWLRNENAMKAQAEQAKRAKEAQEELAKATLDATQTAVMVLAEGGNAASSYFDRLVTGYEDARDALDMAQLLGLPADVIAELQADFDEAALMIGQGADALSQALLAGMLDEETLQALAEAGGEWFRSLYDSLFGEGALEQLQSGWNDVDDLTLERLAELMDTMEDGGAGLLQPLIDAVLSGSIAFDEALGLLGNATGEQVNLMIADLERLEQQLMVDLAMALLEGTDPTGINQNIDIIRRLLDELSGAAEYTGRVVASAITGDGAGTAFSGSGGYTSSSDPNRVGGGSTGVILPPRTTAKFDAELEALRAEIAAASDLETKVRAAINMKVLMENRSAQIAAYDANKDGQVTRDELPGGRGGLAGLQAVISDGLVEGHRRIITGSRRSTSLVRI